MAITTTKIIAIEDSAGVVLPREVLERLGVRVGDVLLVRETPHGVELVALDAETLEDLEVAERVMRKRHDILRKLAQ